MTYLDNAATTFPKPRSVSREVSGCVENYCGNPGRGSHPLALAAADKIFECRELLSGIFRLEKPENVVFTENTTHSLNLAIKGLIRRGDHVIISDMEHNSVYRPVYRLMRDGFIRYDILPTHPSEAIIENAKKLIRSNTRLLVCTHCPNISSAILPIEELGALCRKHNVLFIVDAAQSAGHMAIDMNRMSIDALCVPGHKGLYGIQGCGALLLGENIMPDTLTEGGNGINSLEGGMPDFSPERYETGTLPTPAIAGLCEGIREVNRLGVERIHEHECALWLHARECLSHIPGITIYEPEHSGSVLLFNIKDISSDRIANELGKMEICVRGGYHCSALGHKTLNTPSGGAVRVSFGIFNTAADVEALCEGLHHIKDYE